jgi:uncharacterized protein YciI
MTPTESAPPWPATSRTGSSRIYLPTSADPSRTEPGGLITFQAEDVEQARHAVDTDPFMQEGLLETYWLKQWMPQ